MSIYKMGCTVSVQVQPANIEELPVEETKSTPLSRRDSDDSYITVHLDDDTPVYI
jgi:hypothetical protein